MRIALLIFVGGGVGSVVRYFLGTWITRIYQHAFPLGTLVVNLLACLMVGLLAGVVQRDVDSPMRSILIIGFCGGFSTFSTFTSESTNLVSNGLGMQAVAYIVLSVAGCLAATFFGVWLAGKA